MRASEVGGIQGGTIGFPIGAFFWARNLPNTVRQIVWRVPEKRHSYRPEKRYFCNLIIVLKDDIPVIFLSSLTDDPPIAPTVQLTITKQKNHVAAFAQ